MKNKILIFMLALFLLISIANISAVQYWQQKFFIGNDTSRIRAVVFYETSIGENYIKGGKSFDSYVWYNIYPVKWNTENPNYAVEYCNISVYFWERFENSTYPIFNRTYTTLTDDDFNAKYYVQMQEGDGYIVDGFCKFLGTRPNNLEMPMDFSIVTPTWECKSCQLYEWTLLERDIVKAKNIGTKTSTIMDYIKELVLLNYEFIIILFWFILILLASSSVGLIFIGVYWLFLYLRNIAK
jgi:hypothetical protein